jgi:anti-sigma factor RsiW
MKCDEMKCEAVRKRLIELAYDEFDGAGESVCDRAALERHIEQCPDCRDALAELTSTRDLIARAARLAAPAAKTVHALNVQRAVAARAELGRRP